MKSETVLLIIAFCILMVVLFLFVCKETFAYVNYKSEYDNTPKNLSINLTSNDTNNDVLTTCTPRDGNWIKPGTGITSRSVLNSPCCNPPDYRLPENYKTCNNYESETNPQLKRCLETCCKYVNTQIGSYDQSWYPMARCACSLWCYNSKEPHFSKYGTAVHYISGDIAEAETPDTPDFINPVTGGA
jgi:hypothetical protein